MQFAKIGEIYVNLDRITFVGKGEYSNKGFQVVVRFTGEASNHVILKDKDAQEFLALIDQHIINPPPPEPESKKKSRSGRSQSPLARRDPNINIADLLRLSGNDPKQD